MTFNYLNCRNSKESSYNHLLPHKAKFLWCNVCLGCILRLKIVVRSATRDSTRSIIFFPPYASDFVYKSIMLSVETH